MATTIDPAHQWSLLVSRGKALILLFIPNKGTHVAGGVRRILLENLFQRNRCKCVKVAQKFPGSNTSGPRFKGEEKRKGVLSSPCFRGLLTPHGYICLCLCLACSGLVGLWTLRASKNAAASPMLVCIDIAQGVTHYSTRFNTEVRQCTPLL